jgi:hypothetical protein
MKFGDVIPREHGTWAMWIVPMLSAAIVTHFSMSFTFLFITFLMFFLAHRPLVSFMKNRHGTEVKETLLFVVTPATILAVLLTVAYNLPWLILFWGIELSLFAFSVKTFVQRDQRSLVNELTILSALTLTAPAAFYTITGNIDTEAVRLFLLNFLFFGSSVFYVKTRIELLRSKGRLTDEVRRSRIVAILYHVILVVSIVLMYVFGSIDVLMLLVFIPMIVQAGLGISSKETKVNFIRIGVALVVQSAIFLIGVRLFWN